MHTTKCTHMQTCVSDYLSGTKMQDEVFFFVCVCVFFVDDSCDDTLGHSERKGHICSLDSRRSWLPRDGEAVVESWGRSRTTQQAPWMVSSLRALLPRNPSSRCRWMGMFMYCRSRCGSLSWTYNECCIYQNKEIHNKKTNHTYSILQYTCDPRANWCQKSSQLCECSFQGMDGRRFKLPSIVIIRTS